MWLVRHAESTGQTGSSDDVNPALSERGRQQADRLSAPLERIQPDRIIVSPLMRAWQTLERSGATAPQVAFDSRIVEQADREPCPYEKILPLDTPPLAEPDRQDAWRIHSADRARSLLNDLLLQQGKTFLLFGHNGILGIFCRAFMGLDPRHQSVGANLDNAAISLLAVKDDGRHIIELWNDRAHVIDLLDDPYGFVGSYRVAAPAHATSRP
jgi:broad specificity phosphatase PhoE